MAKSVHAKYKRKTAKARAHKYAPVHKENSIDNSVKLQAYRLRQELKKAEAAGQVLDFNEELKDSIAYAQSLDRCDEQKRRLREKGHFFFVHPEAPEDAFPECVRPETVTPYEGERVYDRKLVKDGDESDEDAPLKEVDDVKVPTIKRKRRKQRKSLFPRRMRTKF